MKKRVTAISAFALTLLTALIINQNIFSDTINTYPSLEITVYQKSITTPQANAEVTVENSDGILVTRGITNSSGIVSWEWDQPYGDYTIKVWYPTVNFIKKAQKTVTYSGSSIYATIILGENH